MQLECFARTFLKAAVIDILVLNIFKGGVHQRELIFKFKALILKFTLYLSKLFPKNF